jgi:hypothetical protein
MSKDPTVIIKSLNFDKDIEFFDYLVTQKLKMYDLFILQPMNAKRETTALNDDTLNNLVNEVSEEMLASFSTVYKNVLLNYFNEEALETFVTERVFFHIYEQGIILNAAKVTKMRSSAMISKANQS